jgi:hypothetical protein
LPTTVPQVVLLERASFEFGHFDAIHDMGTRHLLGRVPGRPRDVGQALRFLAPSASGGGWGRRVRQVKRTLLECTPGRVHTGTERRPLQEGYRAASSVCSMCAL